MAKKQNSGKDQEIPEAGHPLASVDERHEENQKRSEENQDRLREESAEQQSESLEDAEAKTVKMKTFHGHEVVVPAKPSASKRESGEQKTQAKLYYVHAYGAWQELTEQGVVNAITDHKSNLIIPSDSDFPVEKYTAKKK